MGSIKIHGGDFVAGRSGKLSWGTLSLPNPEHWLFGEEIPLRTLMRVTQINKEERHRTGVAVGRGVAGAAVGFLTAGAGIGAVVGFTTTNRISNMTFEAEFEGGRRLLATTDTKTYTNLLAAAFHYNSQSSARPRSGASWKKSLGIILAAYGVLVVIPGMVDRSPVAWGMAVSALVLIAGRSMMRYWDKDVPARNVP